MKVRIERAVEDEVGQQRLSKYASTPANFPADGIVVDGNYIPWSVLDEFRESGEQSVEFDPWDSC